MKRMGKVAFWVGIVLCLPNIAISGASLVLAALAQVESLRAALDPLPKVLLTIAFFGPVFLIGKMLFYWLGLALFGTGIWLQKKKLRPVHFLAIVICLVPGASAAKRALHHRDAVVADRPKIILSPSKYQCSENSGVELNWPGSHDPTAVAVWQRRQRAIFSALIGNIEGDTVKLRPYGSIPKADLEVLQRAVQDGACLNSDGKPFSLRATKIDSRGAKVL